MNIRQYAILVVLLCVVIASNSITSMVALHGMQTSAPSVQAAAVAMSGEQSLASTTPDAQLAPPVSPIIVTSPKDGDVFCANKSIPIVWTAPVGVGSQSLSILSDNIGAGIAVVPAAVSGATTSVPFEYDWTPDTLKMPEGNTYYIGIDAHSSDKTVATSGRSVGVFSITNCPKSKK